MRVLHVLNELRPSGAETMLSVAAPHWARAGVVTTVLSTGAEEGVFAEVFRKQGVRVIHLPFRRHPRYFLKLFHLLREERPDVVHLHPERASVWMAATARLARVPGVVRTVHHIFEFDGLLRFKRTIGRFLLSKLLGVLMVTNSPTNLNNEVRRFKYRPQLIPNWYDEGAFVPPSLEFRDESRRTFRIAPESVAIATLGGCAIYKNHDLLIQALANVPDSRFTYLHIGLEDSGHSERRLAERLGVGQQVYFLGPVDDAVTALAAADVFMMPSSAEGFGIAAVEAIATGIPAVLADVPCLSDLRTVSSDVIWIQPTVKQLTTFLLGVSNGQQRLERGKLPASFDAYRSYEGAAAYAALYRTFESPSQPGKR